MFDLAGRGVRGARPVAHYLAHAALTLSQPEPLVAFVDPHLVESVQARRRQFGQQHQTLVVSRPVEALPLATRSRQLERLSGITNGLPGRDQLWHSIVHLSKVGILAETAALDPFGTGHFAWMDFGIGHVARRPVIFPEPCNRPTLLQMLPVFPEDLDDHFHEFEQGSLAAGLIRGGDMALAQLGGLFHDEMERVIEGGRLPTDQTVLSALSALHPDLFDYTFGDYPSLICNWDLIRRDEDSVMTNIERCVRFQRWHDAESRCRILRESVDAGTAELGAALSAALLQVEQAVHEHLHSPTREALPDRGWRAPIAEPAVDPAPNHPPSSAGLKPADPTIALCMIVKNESEVIGRCLASVLDIIDTWVIVDTGSTDATCELITRCLSETPGTLHRRRWRDFAANRTELLELARGSADYLLLMDADMTLNMSGPLPALAADGYLVRYDGSFRYSVPRLIRGDRPWHFVGVTHEYLSSSQPFCLEQIEEMWVTHHADGGSRADKFQRDRDLLERQLRETPDDPRTVFYLAQTYRDMGDRSRAAELYRRRVSLGGWYEEAFYAALQLGVITADDDWPTGSALLVDAWERLPGRSEALYELATRARTIGDFVTADWSTEVGLGIPLPADILFVHRWVYEWGMRLERSIALARTGRLNEAAALTEELLTRDDLPDDVKSALHLNRQWLSDHGAEADGVAARAHARHRQLQDFCPSAEIVPLPMPDLEFGWVPTNPSVANDGDSLAVLSRAVNYEIDGGGYRTRDPDGVIRTQNSLLRLSEDLAIDDCQPLVEPFEVPRFPTLVRGFEDCRLFRWRDCWWAVATARDLDPQAMCRMVLLRVVGDRWQWEAELPGPNPDRHEKNWMPFVVDDRLHFVYSCRPFVVLCWDDDARELREVRRVATGCRLSGLRGSSPGVAIDQGHMFVTHETRLTGKARPDYLHRFLTVDRTMTPTGISPAFAFVHDGVEFCAGLARRGEDLILSFGIEDRCSAVAIVPIDEALDTVELLGPMAGAGTKWGGNA